MSQTKLIQQESSPSLAPEADSVPVPAEVLLPETTPSTLQDPLDEPIDVSVQSSSSYKSFPAEGTNSESPEALPELVESNSCEKPTTSEAEGTFDVIFLLTET